MKSSIRTAQQSFPAITIYPSAAVKVLVWLVILTALLAHRQSVAQDGSIDASDPTKIYSYAGGGAKYTDYTNGDSMWELRATGNIGLSDQDMVMFELGYGQHSGNSTPGDSSALTNSRFRWFHLFNMDYSIATGYRGWATQIDVQIEGNLKGTDGQNTVAVGALPAFGINERWALFLPVNVIGTWDKKFNNWNGLGLSVAPLLTYSPDGWWPGAFLQFWPSYTRFVSGNLSGEGAGNIDIVTGGEIAQKVLWGLTLQKNFDKHLRSLNRGENTGLKGDWNVFANVTFFF